MAANALPRHDPDIQGFQNISKVRMNLYQIGFRFKILTRGWGVFLSVNAQTKSDCCVILEMNTFAFPQKMLLYTYKIKSIYFIQNCV